MFYDWLEAQRVLACTGSVWAASAGRFWGWPTTGGEPLGPPGCGWLWRFVQPAPEAPPFGIDAVTIDDKRVLVDESVVEQTPFCRLRRFTRRFDAGVRPGGPEHALFVCAPLAGHHAVMLREMIETLLQEADVYVTDWTDARDVPVADGPFGLDDYVMTLVRFMMCCDVERLHLLAVCQATAPTLAAIALLAACRERAPLSLTLMGGPIDTRLNPTDIDRLATTHSPDWFRMSVIDTVPRGYRGAGRRVYPGYLQHAAIVAAHPQRQLALESRYWVSRATGERAEIAASLRALNEYAAVLDMSEDYFIETVQVVFREQRLARGTWTVGGQRVCPDALTGTALCTVEGDRDDITGAGQTHAAQALCTEIPDALRLRLTVEACDHYDLFTGPRWRDAVHPALVGFRQMADKRYRAKAGQKAGQKPGRKARETPGTRHPTATPR